MKPAHHMDHQRLKPAITLNTQPNKNITTEQLAQAGLRHSSRRDNTLNNYYTIGLHSHTTCLQNKVHKINLAFQDVP
jgi:hypothetical protein